MNFQIYQNFACIVINVNEMAAYLCDDSIANFLRRFDVDSKLDINFPRNFRHVQNFENSTSSKFFLENSGLILSTVGIFLISYVIIT